MPRTTLTINGEDKASSEIQKSTNSLKMFAIGYDIVKEALKTGVEIFKKSIESYTESEKVSTQLNAVLKSTGMVAGVTRQSVLELSNALKAKTGIDDDQITAAQNMLLTFTKIGKDTFPAATKAVLDMSVALGQDLKTTSMQVGKALNDTTQGVSALSRVGVQFTDQEKEVIKSLQEAGKQAEAQAIILKKLEQNYGGSAEAMRNTFGGAMQALKNANEDVLKSFGKVIAAVGTDIVNSMAKAAEEVVNFINSAQGIDVISNIAASIGATFKLIQAAIDILKPTFQGMMDVIKNAVSRFSELNDKTNSTNAIFEIFKTAIQAVGVGLSVIGGSIAFVINRVVDLIKIVKDAGAILTAVFSGDLKKAGEEAQKFSDNIKQSMVNSGNEIKGLIDGAVKEFDRIGKSTSAKQLQENYASQFVKIKQNVTDVMNDVQKDIITKTNNTTGAVGDSYSKMVDDVTKNIATIKDVYSMVSGSLQNLSDQYYTNEIAKAEGNTERQKQLKREQFNANKALAITDTIMNTAEAVGKALTYGWPAGVILAGITGAMGAAQVALIASQPMPAFEKGGIVPGTSYTGDNVLARVNSGEMILTRDQQKALGNMGNKTYNFNGPILANNPLEFNRKIQIQTRRFEAARG